MMMQESQFYGTSLAIQVVSTIRKHLSEKQHTTNGQIANDLMGRKPEDVKIIKSHLYRRICEITKTLEKEGIIKRIAIKGESIKYSYQITEIHA